MLHKIAKFLQDILLIKHLSKLYSAAAFFDINRSGKELCSFKCKRKASDASNIEEKCAHLNDSPENISFKMVDPSPTFLSNRISNILEDLGN